MAKASKVRSKSEIFSSVAGETGLTRKQVSQVFDSLTGLIKKDLSKGPGIFAVPGLMKITVVRKPATKEKKVPNPFKPGEMMVVKAKPARKVVKVRPLKGLKAMV
ncbi:MAG: HU family DNA-binding protein [Phycisphaerae bacterium]|jgi:nucleoid DNA-binding protein